MSLAQDQISHLAKLTALKWGSLDISGVIDSFAFLGSVDTSSIREEERSGKGSLTPRPDIVICDEDLPDALLGCTSQKKAAHQIVLSGIMQWE